jgi:tRNA A37 methylthiotransferase MiaB
MNRHYDRSHLLNVMEKLSNIRRDDWVKFWIGADLIVGFPGETDADFEDTLSLVKNYTLVKVHGFPFSAHTSGYTVPAGAFENQVSESIKKERLETLIKAGNERRRQFLEANSGAHLKLLAERITPDWFLGWSENYIELDEKNFKPDDGSVIKRGHVIEGIFTYNPEHGEKHLLDF